jgi:PAS domain S-box-containing protein
MKTNSHENRQKVNTAQRPFLQRKRVFLLHMASCMLTVISSMYLIWQLYIHGRMRQGLLFTVMIIVLIAVSGWFTRVLFRELMCSEESEEKYRQLFNEVNTAIFITDSEGRFLDMNRKATDMLGYSREEMLTMSFSSVLTDQERQAIAPRYHLVEKDASYISERSFMHKDGSVVYAEINASRLSGDRLMGVVKDVTEMKRLQRELEDYKYALDKAAIVTMTDKDGIITYANENFCKISGYTQEELIGRNNSIVNSGYHPQSFFQAFWQTIKSGNVWSGEIRNRAKDGSIYWVNATIVPFLDAQGVPYQYAGIRQDITFRKEEKLRFDKAILQAQEKERNLIGMELHDNVNQLLAAALLYLSATKDKTGNIREFDELVDRSREYILDAVREIRQISHQLAPVSGGKPQSVKELYTSLFHGIQAAYTISFSVDIDDTELGTVDPEINQSIYRIVQELLNNIIKYAAAKNVRFSLGVQDGRVKLCMEDDGVGFDPAAIHSGIGLENIRRRTQSFGGCVQFISAPGKGCKVLAELPVSENQSLVA